MPPARSEIRDLLNIYLERHPTEQARLKPLLKSLDQPDEPTSRTTFPGHITCSAVVIDRNQRVLHIHHRASGLALPPGGHIDADDRTLLAAALREVHEEVGIAPGDLCLTHQLLDAPIDIDVHDIAARPAKGETEHRHYDVRFAFYLAHDAPPILLQDDEVSGVEWLAFDQVTPPTLRTKLIASGLDGRPDPVNASALLHDGGGRYLLHLRDNYPDIWEPGSFALLGGGFEPGDPSLEGTVRRELAEEVPDLKIGKLEPYAVEVATGVDGLAVPVQVFASPCRLGPDEDMVTAVIREGREETGVVIDPQDVTGAVTVHHRPPLGATSRIGVFFEFRRWDGTPQIMQLETCGAMDWFPVRGGLPEQMVAYCRAGLDAYTTGAHLALHFQLPGDPIAFDPGTDRLRIVPAVNGRSADLGPDPAVAEFSEQSVGRITEWTDTSWARKSSRVWRARGAQGGTWYVKVHQNDRFHEREVRGLRTWAPALGTTAPRLVAAHHTLRTVVLTEVPGRPLHGMALSPEQQRAVFQQIGALARRIHQSLPARPAPAGSGPAVAKADRHLAAARSHLRPGDEEFVRDLVRQATDLQPLEWVETHGDFQLRNILYAAPGGAIGAAGAQGCVTVIDLERSEPGPAVRDMVRLSDAWDGRPDLFDAFLAGYGRSLTGAEKARLVTDMALDSVSGIAYGTAHGDPELVERGLRTLARLRAEHDALPSSTGEAR
ncbi:NUDIX domain-containing protein [Streptomyces sp. NPDC059752]|uniref:NUDIX domain-containing protein n=1 Tax=unclassified Streptomyces TaxID=2593676 RepID=UPI00365A42E3